MREILFRGKRIDNGELVEGYYFERKDTQGNIIESVIIDDAYEQIRAGQRYVGSKLNKECFRVDSKTVGQFTGLTDKNGKKIFEGDIVATPRSHAVVSYGEFNCSCCDGVFGWSFGNADIRDYDRYEVIGNIHDNPELLEAD